MPLKQVLITISNIKTADIYIARSYPDRDFNDDGIEELYFAPVYKIFIQGTNARGAKVKKTWRALRFMPYWNDPANPNTHYKSKKWINAGLHQLKKKAVTYYNRHYSVQNTPSPYDGGIQIKGGFLIHAGPQNINEYGWGSAGCVEIIGNFNTFKKDIQLLSGSSKRNTDEALLQLVKARKLFVEIKAASPPDFKMQEVISTINF